MERAQWVGAAVVLLLAVGAGAWYARSSPEPPPVVVAGSAASAPSATVHVSGAVVAPGLVEVAGGSRIADAIVAAGGALPDADLSALNLAAAIIDGQQLVVPEIGSAEVQGGVVADGRVRVNTAGLTELQELPGVGPVLAERILRFREENGPFALVEDLLDVPGIGEGKLAALRDVVEVP